MKHINKPICHVVVYKTNGIVVEFSRTSKGEPKLYSTLNSAIKAVKRLRTAGLHSEHWVAMTTWRLAEQHQINL